MVRQLEVDWQVVLLLAPVGLELLRQALGARFGATRLFYLSAPVAVADRCSSAWPRCSPSSTPIKIWNSARIEHRLQEQEKLLLAAQGRGAQEPDQPALPVQHADVDLVAHPLAAGNGAHAHRTSSRACCAGCCAARSTSSRCARSSTPIDEYLDIEVDPLRSAPARCEKTIAPDTLDVIVPSMILQPLVENSHQARASRARSGPGRITHPQPARRRHARSSRSRTMAWASPTSGCRRAMASGIGLSNVHERLRVHLRRRPAG